MHKRGGFWLLCFVSITVIILAGSQAAEELPKAYHLKLLAVQENGENVSGSAADLYLELREGGSGRVFLETSLLTKLDTQGSTRFAKEIACKHFHLDCETYDFFYTIKADTNIVGGPSAGAAMAALTTIAFLDLPYREDVAVTGTINSGGLIGPVGGVPHKLEAAAAAGMKTVLIPLGSPLNETELQQSSMRAPGIEIVEVIDLDAVLFHLTGQQLNSKEVLIMENEEYRALMNAVQKKLCTRTADLLEEMSGQKMTLPDDVQNALAEGTTKAEAAAAIGNYYSAASFCFANTIRARTAFYEEKELTESRLQIAAVKLEKNIATQEQKNALEHIDTLTDLQTLFIVQERLSDAREKIAELEEATTLKEKYSLLSYAEERFFSAIAWSEFFAMSGKRLLIDEEHLQQSCQQKVAEAEEMVQYADLFLGTFHLAATHKNLDAAKNALNEGQHGVCLLTAAQTKAEASAILSSLGLENATLPDYIASKRQAVERVIAENSAEGMFPILGYSYYQYANALEEEEKGSALLYLEYALEMSELGMYFPEEEEQKESTVVETIAKKLPREWMFAAGGFVVGVLVMGVVWWYGKIRRGTHFGKRAIQRRK
ncbi:MAG: S16 family serine protease [Nanoarchaeota archaeon]|nr:S16 family serine protease [Nanoarchaeota archaeon]